jgi:hypothetical protein
MVLGSLTAIAISSSYDQSSTLILKIIFFGIESIIVVIMIYFFIKTAFADPGIVPRNKNVE